MDHFPVWKFKLIFAMSAKGHEVIFLQLGILWPGNSRSWLPWLGKTVMLRLIGGWDRTLDYDVAIGYAWEHYFLGFLIFLVSPRPTWKMHAKQESIQVGCVPSAAVAICPGGVCSGGVCLGEGVSAQWVSGWGGVWLGGCLPGGSGVCPGGCLPEGESAWGR